jgi:hypothetical protein
MPSHNNYLEREIRQNPIDAKQGGGIGYRLGGFLYWSCLVLAVAWAVLVALVVGRLGDLPRHWFFYLLVFFGPVVLLYGVGRAFRYILSEE